MLHRSIRCCFERRSFDTARSKLHALSPAPESLPRSPYLDVHSMHKILLCTMREPPLNTADAPVLLPKHWHNPLTTPLLKALCDLFTAVSKDPSIHGVVLCAARNGQSPQREAPADITKEEKPKPKERIFSAGLDLRALQHMTTEAFEELWFTLQELWIVMHLIQKPLIACMDGNALGLGCALSLACDVRVARAADSDFEAAESAPQKAAASDGWKIGLNEARYGFLTPPWVAGALSYLIGHRQTDKLIQTGALITPSHAHSLGMVDLLVQNDPKVTAVEHMHQMLSVPAYGRAQAKSMLRRELLGPLATADDRMHDMTHFTTLLRTRGFKNVLGSYIDHMDPETQMLPSESRADSWDPKDAAACGENVSPGGLLDDELNVTTSERTMEAMTNANVGNRDAGRF